jgi:glutathione S-transferase
MKLIASLTSPYVRKIRVLLLEKGIPFELVLDSPWEATTHVPDFNPLGKVPALVTHDGEVFFDSPVIADYLETLGVYAPELPADAMACVRIRQIEALADGVVDAGVAWFLETRRPADKQMPEAMERQRGKILRSLAELEKRLGVRDWMHGDSLSRADIAVGCALLWLDFRLGSFDWRAGHPALTRFVARLSERPSFAQTVPVL